MFRNFFGGVVFTIVVSPFPDGCCDRRERRVSNLDCQDQAPFQCVDRFFEPRRQYEDEKNRFRLQAVPVFSVEYPQFERPDPHFSAFLADAEVLHDF